MPPRKQQPRDLGHTESEHPTIDRQELARSIHPSALARAQSLAVPARWRVRGRNERAAWGEIRGAQPDPYRVAVDLQGPAFKCTCPARRSPCRHALGLALSLADDPNALPRTDPPAWVTTWIASRDARSRTRSPGAPPVDEATRRRREAAKHRRADARERRVQAGVGELSRFLQDLVRRGLASLSDSGYRTWDEMAARMVDAQAPGLARLVRELGDVAHAGPGWEDRFLERLGRLHLLLEAFGNLDCLDPDVGADVRSLVGFPVPREQLAHLPALDDVWWVLARRLELQDQLQTQRVWIVGETSRRFALVLEFAAGGKALDGGLTPGRRVQGAARFYPGTVPLRVALDETRRASTAHPTALPGVFRPIAAQWQGLQEALMRFPWLERYPMALEGVIPEARQGGWWLRDQQGAELPARPYGEDGWLLLAASGGHPIDVFGEWNGEAVAPMSLVAAEGLVPLAHNPLFLGW